MFKRTTHDSMNGKSENLLKLMRIIEQFGTDIDEPQPVQVVVNTVDASKKRN
jgi:hypothetical protein